MVHNGIIENYEELIKIYSLNKKNIKSATDTEVIAEVYNKLISKSKNHIEALINLMNKIEGSFAFAFLVKGKKSISGLGSFAATTFAITVVLP